MDLVKVDTKPLAEKAIAEAPNTGNPLRRAILEMNRERNGSADIGWGRNELNIPELDMYLLWARFPDLKSPDAEIQRKAWLRFINSSLSEPYKINKAFTPGIIVK